MTLRPCRDRRALGTAELAACAGVSKVTVIGIEHGRVTAIKRRTLRRLTAAPEVEPADVVEFRRALSGDAAVLEDQGVSANSPFALAATAWYMMLGGVPCLSSDLCSPTTSPFSGIWDGRRRP
jgi:DNA-binding Xre family transcriptional regulator